MGQQETTMRATGSALRRMVLALAIAALLVMALAAPASAVANDKYANQVAKQTSGLNQSSPGFGGQLTREEAKESTGMGEIASNSHYTRP